MRLVNVALLVLIGITFLRVVATRIDGASNASGTTGGALMCAIPFFLAWRGLAQNASASLTSAAWYVNLAVSLLMFATPVIAAVASQHVYWAMLFPVAPALLFAANVKALAVRRAQQRARPELIEPEWRKSSNSGEGAWAPFSAVESSESNASLESSTSSPSSTPGTANAPSAEPRRTRSNYLVRHWRGELPLPVSYWINGTLLSLVSIAVIFAVGTLEQYSFASLRLVSATSLALLAGSVLSSAWSTVGIWRSAGHHVSRGGSNGWAIVARTMVVFSVFGALSHLITTVVPQMRVYGLIAIGQDPIGRYRVSVSADGRSVRVYGTLREGAAEKIIGVLDAAPAARWLVLDSNGGRLHEARVLAQAVRARELNTYVGRMCASACTYVFLAGKTRAASPYARIGFHQPSFVGLNAAGQQLITQRMLDVYREAGLPDAFIQRVGRTPPSQIWYPTPNELLDAHVVTIVGSPVGLHLY